MAVSVECVITVGQCDRIFDVDASWCGCYSPRSLLQVTAYHVSSRFWVGFI